MSLTDRNKSAIIESSKVVFAKLNADNNIWALNKDDLWEQRNFVSNRGITLDSINKEYNYWLFLLDWIRLK